MSVLYIFSPRNDFIMAGAKQAPIYLPVKGEGKGTTIHDSNLPAAAWMAPRISGRLSNACSRRFISSSDAMVYGMGECWICLGDEEPNRTRFRVAVLRRATREPRAWRELAELNWGRDGALSVR